MENEFSFQNSKVKNVYAKYLRSKVINQNKFNSNLDHYINLCKSLKCLIHTKPIDNLKKKALNWKLANKKTTIKWKRPGGIKRRPRCYNLCKVEEFEKDKKGEQEEFDRDSFLKIESSIVYLDTAEEIKLEDIVGNGFLKDVIDRTIIWPMIKPNIFKGLRSAPRGVLLFGPPGTGKTLIGQSIAYETQWTFFNIPSSLLTSEWAGESEKLVRTMFAVAKARQPSLIFIDEIDSLLSCRNTNENGSNRRMKNEFLENMDGCNTEEENRVMVIGVTNRPHELDEAARCRFAKRLYVPLPDENTRKDLLVKLLQNEPHTLEESDIQEIVGKTRGFSLSDLKNLCQEAAMGPIKSLSSSDIFCLEEKKIRPIALSDFLLALRLIKPSVTEEELEAYEVWDLTYGYSSERDKN